MSRLDPPLTSVQYAVRRPLVEWLRAQDVSGARILDVGAGERPYDELLTSAAEVVGFDRPGNPHADLHGSLEAIPVEDASFDVVLCTQVLEHCDDPAAAVRELRRVTRPGGRVLASTHGVQVYHPSPADYWRWTHEGLRRLFTTGADWTDLAVEPAAGTGSALAMLLATYVEIALRRSVLARPPVWALNGLGTALDRRVGLLRQPVPGSLIPNLHVVAIP